MKMIKNVMVSIIRHYHFAIAGLGIYLTLTDNDHIAGSFLLVTAMIISLMENLLRIVTFNDQRTRQSLERKGKVIMTAMAIEDYKAKNKSLVGEVKALKATLINISGERSAD